MRQLTSLLVMLALSACARPNAAYLPDGAQGETDAEPVTTAGVTTEAPVTTGIGPTEGSTTGKPGTGPETTTGAPPADVGTGGESGQTKPCFSISGACSLSEADTCEEGSRCRPWDDGLDQGIACVEDVRPDEPLSVGDRCVHRCGLEYGVDDCPGGSICDPSEGADSTCVELCASRDDCTVGVCVVSGEFALCRPEPVTCDPLLQDCPDGQGCYPSGDTCQPAGPVPTGGQCFLSNDCQAGNVCLSNAKAPCLGGFESCCAALCDPLDGGCDKGLFCQDFADGFGVCVSA